MRVWSVVSSLLALGLACAGPPSPVSVPAPNVPEAAPTELPAPDVLPEPTGPIADQARALNLDPVFVARLARYDAAVAAVHGAPDALCPVVTEAIALGAALAADRALEQATDDAQVGALGKALVGVYLEKWGMEGIRAAPSLGELAGGADPASAALLTATDRWIGADGWSGWMEQVGDSTACATPGDAVPSLTALAAAWPTAPACLRDAVRPSIQADLDDMGAWSCFCAADASSVQAEIDAVKPALEALGSAGGPVGKVPVVGPGAIFDRHCG